MTPAPTASTLSLRAILSPLSALLLVGLAGCGSPSEAGPGSDEPGVRGLVRQFEAAWNAADPTALSELYTTEGTNMPPGKEPVSGRGQIEASYRSDFQRAHPLLELDVDQLHAAGDWGTASGSLTAQMMWEGGRQGPSAQGKWIVVARRGGDGTWRISRFLWNWNRPAGGFGG